MGVLLVKATEVVVLGRIPVPGCELIYDELGTGEPLVLVHGTGAQASTWRGTVGDLAAGGYRVIDYDRRGFGRSTHRPVRDYRVHVADLAAVIEGVGAPRPRSWLELWRQRRDRACRRAAGSLSLFGDRRGTLARPAKCYSRPCRRARAGQAFPATRAPPGSSGDFLSLGVGTTRWRQRV